MKSTLKKITLSIAALGSLMFSSVTPAFAQTPIDICPSGTFGGVCNTSVNALISNVIQGVFVIAILIALFFLIWGGLNWIISQGNKEKVTAARNTLVAALIGLIVVFLSYFLLNVVIQLLFGQNVNQVLNSVTTNGIFNSGGNNNAAPALGVACGTGHCPTDHNNCTNMGGSPVCSSQPNGAGSVVTPQ